MLCIKFGCFLRGGSTPHEATRSRLYNILLWILRRSLQSKLNVFAPAALRICFHGALALSCGCLRRAFLIKRGLDYAAIEVSRMLYML
jgi:hypothetical protein